MRWLWADWGGRDRAQQTQGTAQVERGAPSGRLKTGKLGRARGRTQTRPRVALAAQAAASATGPLGRAPGAAGQASLGSAYADTSEMTFFAPAVAPASTVAAMYWEAGRNTWERWEPRADTQRDWPGAGYGVAGDAAHNDLRADGRAAMTRPRSAATSTVQATPPAATERRGQAASDARDMGGASDAAKASRRARHGLTTTLLRATAQAAEALGRAPEEVWAEALNVWLANQEAITAADGGQPTRAVSGQARPIEVRRQETWSEIDATLSALRAS